MMTISTGEPSTLGTYRKLASKVFGEDSLAVEYLDSAIRESPKGADEEVIAEEGQMVFWLVSLHRKRENSNE